MWNDTSPASSPGQNINSVGIDVGTTTTLVVISRLTLKNVASASSIPRIEITGKEVLYQSRPRFTPLLDRRLIDFEQVLRIVDEEYQKAGFSPEQIDTGAVIITGETAKKDNADQILHALAGYAGEFVVATAGANLEAIIAGRGSGAAASSQEKHRLVGNIDVGGGTSNIAYFREGRAIDSTCANVGGRLIEIDGSSGKVVHITSPGQAVLDDLGLNLRAGDLVDFPVLKRVTSAMARCVLEAACSRDHSPLTRRLLMTPPLRLDYQPGMIMFSGGVADHLYRNDCPVSIAETAVFGDLGPLLGCALRDTFAGAGLLLTRPKETIRATVIGAGVQSLSVSGSTISVSEGTLPLKNVPVVRPFDGVVPEDPCEIAQRVSRTAGQICSGDGRPFAIALSGPQTLRFADVENLARGLGSGLAPLPYTGPVVVVLEADCAKVLGQTMRTILGPDRGIISIDQVSVSDGDYIDIGKPVFGGRVVPVVIKTLVFEGRG